MIASHAYDVNGNRLTAIGESGFFTGTYNDRDQILNYGSTAYTHNANELIARADRRRHHSVQLRCHG